MSFQALSTEAIAAILARSKARVGIRHKDDPADTAEPLPPTIKNIRRTVGKRDIVAHSRREIMRSLIATKEGEHVSMKELRKALPHLGRITIVSDGRWLRALGLIQYKRGRNGGEYFV